jgi:hypothetical protein
MTRFTSGSCGRFFECSTGASNVENGGTRFQQSGEWGAEVRRIVTDVYIAGPALYSQFIVPSYPVPLPSVCPPGYDGGMSNRHDPTFGPLEIARLTLLLACSIFVLLVTDLRYVVSDESIAFSVMALIIWAGGVFALVRWLNRRDEPSRWNPPPDPP